MCAKSYKMLEVVLPILPRIPELLLVYWFLAAGSVLVTVLPVPVPEAFKWVTPDLTLHGSRPWQQLTVLLFFDRAAVTVSASRGKLWQGKPAALGRLQVSLQVVPLPAIAAPDWVLPCTGLVRPTSMVPSLLPAGGCLQCPSVGLGCGAHCFITQPAAT
jgi:hypothetical protein